MGPFHFYDMSEPLKNSIALPAAKYFDNIDPQPKCVVSTEIASGRFEDDLRRMRMAAWHGADHLMVIRTIDRSHIDGLMEGTPEGTGSVPITRKQIRATRRACDLIEAEVGRPLSFHSYVSGVAGKRGGGALRRGRRQWRSPGSAVQRALSQRRHVPLLRRRS